MKKLLKLSFVSVAILLLLASAVSAGGYARSLGVFRAPGPVCGAAGFVGDCGGYVQQQVLAAPLIQQSYAVQQFAAPVYTYGVQSFAAPAYGYGGAAFFRQRGFFRTPRFFGGGFGGSRFFFRGRGFSFGFGRFF